MSKLYKLKKWLTISETANHLSQVLSETVSEVDVLRLALDGHLKLCLRLTNITYAKPWVKVRLDEVEYNMVKALDGQGQVSIAKLGPLSCPEWFNGQAGECLQLRYKDVTELDADVWDFPMVGAGRLCVIREYQRLVGGAESTDSCLDGVVLRGLTGGCYQLQEHFSDNPYADRKSLETLWEHHGNFYPAAGLPDNDFTAVVVRTKDLSYFLNTLQDDVEQLPRPVSTRERDSLYKVIIGMAVKGYGYDPAAKRSEVIPEIVRDLEAAGVAVSDDSVRKYIKEAAQLLPGKTA